MGITLETAEERTKIRRKYLEALENENFGLLPGRVYVKGFLKNYGRLLGLDSDMLVSAYEERIPQAEKDDDQIERIFTGTEKQRGGKIFKVAIALAAVALVAAFIYLPSFTGGSKATPPGGVENKLTNENKPVTEGKTEKGKDQGKPEKQQGVSVTLNVTDNESWMHVEVDGKPVFTGFMGAGQSKEFKGNEKVSLRIGNAGVVQVEFNGQKIGVLGGFGQVVTKEFKPPQV